MTTIDTQHAKNAKGRLSRRTPGVSLGPTVQIRRTHRDNTTTLEALPEWIAEFTLVNNVPFEKNTASARIVRRSPNLDRHLLMDISYMMSTADPTEAA